MRQGSPSATPQQTYYEREPAAAAAFVVRSVGGEDSTSPTRQQHPQNPQGTLHYDDGPDGLFTTSLPAAAGNPHEDDDDDVVGAGATVSVADRCALLRRVFSTEAVADLEAELQQAPLALGVDDQICYTDSSSYSSTAADDDDDDESTDRGRFGDTAAAVGGADGDDDRAAAVGEPKKPRDPATAASSAAAARSNVLFGQSVGSVSILQPTDAPSSTTTIGLFERSKSVLRRPAAPHAVALAAAAHGSKSTSPPPPLRLSTAAVLNAAPAPLSTAPARVYDDFPGADTVHDDDNTRDTDEPLRRKQQAPRGSGVPTAWAPTGPADPTGLGVARRSAALPAESPTATSTVVEDAPPMSPAAVPGGGETAAAAADDEADHATAARDVGTRYAVHHHGDMAKLAQYETIDYLQPLTDLYKEHAEELSKHGGRRLKTPIILAIGLAVGLWATLLFHTIDQISSLRVHYVLQVTARQGPAAGFALYLLISVGMAALSTGCCRIHAAAAGSGVPEVMAFLNGVDIQGVFDLKVLVLKTISCVGAVSGSLPVGAEGPMIHIGALIGRGIGTGHSKSLGIGKGGTALRAWFRPFQNPKDRMHFVTTGAAAGVTSVFGSPLGGMLFVMEELASYFPMRLAWKAFLACLTTFSLMQLVNNALDGWHLPDDPTSYTPYYDAFAHRTRNETLSAAHPLVIVESVATLFNLQQNMMQRIPLDLRSFAVALVVGIGSAALGIGFIRLHLYIIAAWRSRYVNPKPNPHRYRFHLEPVAAAVLFAVLWFWVPYTMPCQPIPSAFYDTARSDLAPLVLVTQMCNENADRDASRYTPMTSATRPTHFHPFASLSITSSYNSIRLLFARNIDPATGVGAALFPWYVPLVYLVLYGTGAAFCVGMAIASGVVIPTIVIGAALGQTLCGGFWTSAGWASPGLAAFLGAAGFFSGLSRLTFSVVVIMVEITDEIEHVPLLMVAMVVAKQIADRFCHSLYHEQLALRGVPFLDFDDQVHKLDAFTAKDIATPNPVALPVLTTVREIATLLMDRSVAHHGFPVYRPEDDGGYGEPTEAVAAQQGRNGSADGPNSKRKEQRRRRTATAAAVKPPRRQPAPPRHFLGLVTRGDLRSLMWYLSLWHSTYGAAQMRSSHLHSSGGQSLHTAAAATDGSDGRAVAYPMPPIPTQKDLQDVEEARFWNDLPLLPPEVRGLDDGTATTTTGFPKTWAEAQSDLVVDLTPFLDVSAAFVVGTMCVSQAYSMFRNMHLRHLAVVSRQNRLLGIITRRDLMGGSLHARCVAALRAQLRAERMAQRQLQQQQQQQPRRRGGAVAGE